MKISIIIPARNEEENIEKAITSALNTNPWEVIVVDGSSDDKTFQIASSFPCTTLKSSPGRGKQQNAGAEYASGDLFLFLHADCQLPSDALHQIEEAVSEEPYLYGAFEHRIDAEGWLYRRLESYDANRVRKKGIPYGDQGIFIERKLFENMGGFPDVKLMEDLILMRSIKQMFHLHPVLLSGPLTISPRRWQEKGIIRQSMRNWFLRMAERCGVSPDRLATFYAPHKK